MGAGAWVLVVDNEPEYSEMIDLLLRDEGYQTVVARNPAEAIELGRHRRFDAVLLDYNLTDDDADAGRVAATLRAAHGAALPIVLVSAALDITAIAERLGTTRFVRKPFGVTALLDAVEAAVAAGRLVTAA